MAYMLLPVDSVRKEMKLERRRLLKTETPADIVRAEGLEWHLLTAGQRLPPLSHCIDSSGGHGQAAITIRARKTLSRGIIDWPTRRASPQSGFWHCASA